MHCGGDLARMKQFIEEGVELSNNSIFEFLKSVVCMFVLAPYNLVNTVSTRIIYLKRSCIAKMLLCSVAISAAVTLVNACVMIYFGQFSLTLGKFPLIIMIADTVILILLYFLFGSIDFVTYSQLDALSLTKNTEEKQTQDVTAEDSEFQDFQETEASTVTEEPKAEDSVNKEISTDSGTANVNEDSASQECADGHGGNAETAFWVERLAAERRQIFIGIKLSKDERKLLDKELDRSEEISEFLSEHALAVAEAAANTEDLSNLEMLDINVIPSKFRALA